MLQRIPNHGEAAKTPAWAEKVCNWGLIGSATDFEYLDER
jgi:hypothetical protein